MEHYRPRTQHPPRDAEKVTVADGRVTRVHRDIDPASAYGEYTGVARFSVGSKVSPWIAVVAAAAVPVKR